MSDNPESYNPLEGGYPGDNYDCGDTYGSEFPAEDEDECPHQYAETHLGTGVKCIKCGHFVGNWET